MEFEALLAATWPAAETVEAGGFLLRRGAGGGSRVSAASRTAGPCDIAAAEAGLRAWGQRPLFRIGPDEAALDEALAARGYSVKDPTAVLAAPVGALTGGDIDEFAILCDAPLACMEAIWAAGGIGPARLRVMERVAVPRIWILGRHGDRPVGAAFVAAQGGAAMLHALEIGRAYRRAGVARRMTRAAAAWARRAGADTLVLAVTRANTAALSLYAGLGMAETGSYHYRAAPSHP